mgnify:CR=1 FL=1
MENDKFYENKFDEIVDSDVPTLKWNGPLFQKDLDERMSNSGMVILRIEKTGNTGSQEIEVKKEHRIRELIIEGNLRISSVRISENPYIRKVSILSSSVNRLYIYRVELNSLKYECRILGYYSIKNYKSELSLKLTVQESKIDHVNLEGVFFNLDLTKTTANSLIIDYLASFIFRESLDIQSASQNNRFELKHSTIGKVNCYVAFRSILLIDNNITRCVISAPGDITTLLGIRSARGNRIDTLELHNLFIDIESESSYYNGVGSFFSGIDFNVTTVKTYRTSLLYFHYHNVVFTDSVSKWMFLKKDEENDDAGSFDSDGKLALVNYTQISNYREVLLKYHKNDLAENLRPLELGQLRKYSWEGKRWLTWLMLAINRVTNNYGSNYALPIAWYLVLSLLAYALIFNPLEHGYFMADKYFYMLNPAHRFDILMEPLANEVMDWMWNLQAAPYVDFFHRIVNGFLIFQIIRAFRRYTR